MTKRIAVIVGLLLAFGATGVVAVAIWPERAGETGSTSTAASQPLDPAPMRVQAASRVTRGGGRP